MCFAIKANLWKNVIKKCIIRSNSLVKFLIKSETLNLNYLQLLMVSRCSQLQTIMLKNLFLVFNVSKGQTVGRTCFRSVVVNTMIQRPTHPEVEYRLLEVRDYTGYSDRTVTSNDAFRASLILIITKNCKFLKSIY